MTRTPSNKRKLCEPQTAPGNSEGFASSYLQEKRKRYSLDSLDCMSTTIDESTTSTFRSALHLESSTPSEHTSRLDRPNHFSSAKYKFVALLMEDLLQNKDIQYSGLRFLTECGPNQLGTERFVARLLEATIMHADNDSIQIEAFRGLLFWMKIDKTVLFEMGERLSDLIFPLENVSGSLLKRYLMLDILKTLVVSHEGRQQILRVKNTVGHVLMNVLKSDHVDVYTHQIGLSILSWLVEDKQLRDFVASEGGMDYVLHTMKEFAADEVIQCNGAATLCWLVRTESESSGMAPLCQSGQEVIIETMTRFADNPMVFGNCLCILSGSQIPSNDSTCSMRRMIDLAIAGIRQHISFPKVHLNAIILLRSLASNPAGALLSRDALLSNLDLVETVILTSGDESCTTQIEAFGMLAQLCSTQEIAETISGSRCVELAVRLQREHPQNVRLQRVILWFLACLLESPRSAAQQAFGGGHTVLALLAPGLFDSREQQHLGHESQNTENASLEQ